MPALFLTPHHKFSSNTAEAAPATANLCYCYYYSTTTTTTTNYQHYQYYFPHGLKKINVLESSRAAFSSCDELRTISANTLIDCAPWRLAQNKVEPARGSHGASKAEQKE